MKKVLLTMLGSIVLLGSADGMKEWGIDVPQGLKVETKEVVLKDGADALLDTSDPTTGGKSARDFYELGSKTPAEMRDALEVQGKLMGSLAGKSLEDLFEEKSVYQDYDTSSIDIDDAIKGSQKYKDDISMAKEDGKNEYVNSEDYKEELNKQRENAIKVYKEKKGYRSKLLTEARKFGVDEENKKEVVLKDGADALLDTSDPTTGGKSARDFYELGSKTPAEMRDALKAQGKLMGSLAGKSLEDLFEEKDVKEKKSSIFNRMIEKTKADAEKKAVEAYQKGEAFTAMVEKAGEVVSLNKENAELKKRIAELEKQLKNASISPVATQKTEESANLGDNSKGTKPLVQLSNKTSSPKTDEIQAPAQKPAKVQKPTKTQKPVSRASQFE